MKTINHFDTGVQGLYILGVSQTAFPLSTFEGSLLFLSRIANSAKGSS
jgi:hypothetical protein